MKYLILLSLFLFQGAFASQNHTGLINQISTTATGTSTQVLPDNYNRAYLIIQNNGSASVIIKFGSSQTGSEGIIIPAGGNYEPFIAPIGSLFIKSSTGSQAVFVAEGV